MATIKPRSVGALTASDLEAHPVWRFVSGDSRGEALVRPVRRLPVSRLDGVLVATRLGLSSGTEVWGLLGNLDPASAEKTSHFLSASVLHAGKWFHLARYHDSDRDERGPDALAGFLGLAASEVFPLKYDISSYLIGLADVVRGEIPAEPQVRLSRRELIGLAVP
jgi:hypothetical protein